MARSRTLVHEDLRDLLDIQNDDAHRVLADCEDEMAVYNAIRKA